MSQIPTSTAPETVNRLFPTPAKISEARERLIELINQLNRKFPGYPVDDSDAISPSSEFWRGPKGICRVCFREDDMKSRDWLQEQFRHAGCDRVWMDSWGNVYAEVGPEDATPIFLRSHTDSVYEGGPLDGILGVMIGVVVAEYMTSNHIPAGHKLVFGSNAAEEMLYGGHYIGSEALAGTLPKKWFATAKCPEGTTLKDDMEKAGLTHQFDEVYPAIDQVALSIEVHIEQDDQLEKVNLPLGLPERISGVRYFHQFITSNENVGEDLYPLLRPVMEMGAIFEAITSADSTMPMPTGSANTVAIKNLEAPTNAFQVPGYFNFDLIIGGVGYEGLESDLQALCAWIAATERTQVDLSDVRTANGECSCRISIEGYFEHEGAPPMNERRDAFRSFCKFRLFFDQLTGASARGTTDIAIEPTPDTRMTIGLFEITDNQLYYTVVAKETDVGVLNDLQSSIEAVHNKLPTQYPVTTASQFGGYSNPVKCDQEAIALAENIAQRKGFGIQRMVSMPGHDVTQFPKPLLIFVRNQCGSHNPNETMRGEDLEPLLQLVDEILASLNHHA